MKFLHIIHLNEQNGYQLFKQLHETYDLTEHTFLVCNSKSSLKLFPSYQEFDNFVYLPNNRFQKAILIYRLMKQAKYIIFNSLLFNSDKYLIFIYLCCKRFLQKAAWMEWGADLYNWRRKGTDFKSKLLNYINYHIRKEIKVVGVTFEADDIEVHKQFGANVKCYFTPLPFGADRKEMLEKTYKHQDDKKFIRIQIAHNSLQVNNHIPILSRLETFAHENIQLVLPLNYGVFGIGKQYGGTQYRNSVILCAKSLFKDKVTIISKKMPLQNYLQYLRNIDIAIFDCERPIALANIYYMLYMGKKVYLPSSSVHYQFFKRIGLPIYATDDIPHMSFDEFTRQENISNIHIYILDKFTPGKEIQFWGDFFTHIEYDLGTGGYA